MPKLPVALILFAVLLFLALHLWRNRRDSRSAGPLLLVTLLAAVQALLATLRWDYGFTDLRILHVVLASTQPSLSWLAFRQLSSGQSMWRLQNLAHFLPLALVVVALLMFSDGIDLILVSSFLFYGFKFLRLALSHDDNFGETSFEGLVDMRRAVSLLSFTLLGSALVDTLVFLDFLRLGGQNAAWLIGYGNLAWLIAIGASVVLGNSAPEAIDDVAEDASSAEVEPDHQAIADTIEKLLTQNSLALDPSLNLSRLARRAGLPMRSVSNAINRVHNCNVSQYINEIRIKEACRLLRETDSSITQAIYASGFQTKSNFNREFLRVTGQTPRDWRKQHNSG